MSLKKNVIANYVGQAWTALMGLVFVPIYIKYLGIESYGLVGVFLVLQAWLNILDMGMTPTLSREMARYTAGAHDAESIRNLLRTLEYLCFSIAIFLMLFIYLCSDWLAEYWLKTEKLAITTLTQALLIMGLLIALRFIEGLYRGAIVGLQKQVWLNITSSILATIRSVGAVLVLIYIAPTIELFFFWQAFVSLLTIIAFIIATYQHLPASLQSAKFSLSQLKHIWRFSSGMMIITVLSLLLTQVDKIVLSRVLTLEIFGYYTLAGIIANTLTQLIAPITQAYYPRFTELVTQENTAELIKIYHQSAKLVSLLLLPATLVLIFFGDKLLLLWTANPELTHHVMPLLILLTLGTTLNCLMHIPFLLTIAYGWTKFSIYSNIIAVALLVPLTIWASLKYGATGAAWVWVILNIGYIFISIHFLYHRLLKTEKWRWYINDLFLPLLGTAIATLFCFYIQPDFTNQIIWLVWLLVTAILMILSAWMATFGLTKLRLV